MSLLMRVTGNVTFLANNCFYTLTPNCSKVKFYKINFSKILIRSERWCSARFMCSGNLGMPGMKNDYVEYDKLLAQRRKEAERTIIVQLSSYHQCAEVYTHCLQFGKINTVYHYTTPMRTDKQNFLLIEFEHKQNVDAVLSTSTFMNLNSIMPVQSTTLKYRYNSLNKKEVKNSLIEQMKLIKNSCKVLDDAEIIRKLLKASSVSDQIMIMYNSTKLNDAGTRLRFYTACQIQKCYQSLLPNIAVLPFGSSVNGFGKQNCDLDLCLVLNTNEVYKTESKFIFYTKPFSHHDRQSLKRMLESLAETIHIFLPGVYNVKKILEARVPIIKFDHLLCGVECDITMSNMTAYYMSEMLYIFGEIDPRVRPLTFAVRRWAQNSLLVNKNQPGPWITNFPLTLMVIFFLQQKQILPDINTLKSKASKSDIRIVDAYADCTFLRNISKIPKTKDESSLESLLHDFFRYYSDFDFAKNALSLNLGKPIPKPEHSSLYICNPLETNLNVSKNVSNDQVERIVKVIRASFAYMDTLPNKEPDKWGLIGLIKNKYLEENVKNKTSLDFQTLFEKEEVISMS